MTDIREAILSRLVEVVALDAFTTVARDKTQLSDTARPAVVVMDGTEQVEEGYGRGKPSTAPVIVSMRPEVWVFAGSTPEAIGPLISGLRGAIIQAVLTDSSLQTLCKDGDVRYEGCTTNFTSGQRIEADLGLVFSLRYVLRPNDF